MDMISRTLEHLGGTNKDIFVIQIGAMDGVSFDDTRWILDKYKWRCLLVEPIPELFDELKENFKDRDNYIFEQSAISNVDGEVEMLTVPNETIIKEDLHPGYKGMSGLFPLKNGFGSSYERDIMVKEKFGKTITVPSLTFNSLCEKHNIDNFDVLICDIEGYDWELLNQIDLSRYTPDFIRLEYINLTDEEKRLTQEKLTENGYVFEIGQDIDAVKSTLWDQIKPEPIVENLTSTPKLTTTPNLTVVTGLWNIGRTERDFEEHYIANFKKFLDFPVNMFIYIEEKYEHIVWEKRSTENTFVKHADLNYIKNLYSPFWDKTQEIRTDPNWFNMTGEGGWLKSSPQATLEWYNPIVQSKMFLLNDATIWNPFNHEYFIWLDAGITNTVYENFFIYDRALDGIIEHLNSFLFLSYPYNATDEIHGFNFRAMNRFAGDTVKYVCRGGLFGGKKEFINQANATYYALLQQTLNEGYMGTEESIFSIMSYKEPHIYDRYSLDENGLIVKFIDDLIKNKVKIEPIVKKREVRVISNRELRNVKTNSYILTFNFPQQLLHTIASMEKVPEWLEKPHLVLIDNSTDQNARIQNKEIAEKYNMEYIPMERNTGICGGRQKAAEHFHESDADYMFFFEDDMTINSKEFEGQFCRNGFRKYVPNVYDLVHKIIMKEDFDFVKMSFTEVYFDNDKALPWYNVPQNIRTRDWPDYDQLPVSGLDPNSPPAKYDHIKVMDGTAYITGEVNYCNWPMIVSKAGNQKMFIDTKWAHPFEQTWSSHVHQLTKEGKIRAAVLLASPIWHDRILWYKPEERREN